MTRPSTRVRVHTGRRSNERLVVGRERAGVHRDVVIDLRPRLAVLAHRASRPARPTRTGNRRLAGQLTSSREMIGPDDGDSRCSALGDASRGSDSCEIALGESPERQRRHGGHQGGIEIEHRLGHRSTAVALVEVSVDTALPAPEVAPHERREQADDRRTRRIRCRVQVLVHDGLAQALPGPAFEALDPNGVDRQDLNQIPGLGPLDRHVPQHDLIAVGLRREGPHERIDLTRIGELDSEEEPAHRGGSTGVCVIALLAARAVDHDVDRGVQGLRAEGERVAPTGAELPVQQLEPGVDDRRGHFRRAREHAGHRLQPEAMTLDENRPGVAISVADTAHQVTVGARHVPGIVRYSGLTTRRHGTGFVCSIVRFATHRCTPP